MRLIDADKLVVHLKDEIEGCKPLYCGRTNGKSIAYGTVLGLKSAIAFMEALATIEAEPVVHGEWIDGRCSNCNEEALSTSWDEPVYDYDWEESLRYSHTETHTEYHLTDYCPKCGASMKGAKT